MEVVLLVLIFLTILFAAMTIGLAKEIKEDEQRYKKLKQEKNDEISKLNGRIGELEQNQHDRKIDSLSLLLKDQDYNQIKVGTKFVLLSAFSNNEPIHVNRVLLQLPNNKYQLVAVDVNGSVTGGIKMGVVDTLDEVIKYIKQYPYAVVEY